MCNSIFISIIFILIIYYVYNNLQRESFTQDITNHMYFIVMKNYPERVRNINSIIQTHRLRNPHIFSAIDGTTLNRARLLHKGMITPKMYHKLKPGALGCVMSHITLWKKLVSSGNKYMIIFEDDLKLDNQFNQKLKTYLQHLPKDFDLSNLFVNPFIQYKTNFSKNDRLNRYVKKGYPEYGTLCYIISRKGAITLLQKCIPIYTTVDDMIANEIKNKNIITYKPIYPFSTGHTDMISSICKDSKSCGGIK
jgi:GR25 family glycosyltransferase involved in LPS biosynthesis